MITIWIGFSRALGFAPLSDLIRWVERTDFSHAFVRVRSESLNRDLIYEATGKGVYFVGSEAFKHRAQIIKEFPILISTEAKNNLLRWAVDTSGRPYGTIQLLGLAIKRLAALLGKQIKNPIINGRRSYICTELVAEALKSLNLIKDSELEDIGLKELLVKVEEVYKMQRETQ